jgi:hypothetical protein
MSENLKNALLVVITIATLANTVILLGDDNNVSYDRTHIATSSNVSNSAANPAATQAVQPATVIENIGPKTTIAFTEMEHNFGTVDQNTTNPTTFSFTNSGDEPLIISDAKGSCGCTVPDYPRQPIQPGETGEINVVYKPGSQANKQTKTVTITANTEPATTVLRITADVTPGENTGTEETTGQTIELGGQ